MKITAKTLAEITGLSDRRHRQMVERGIITPGKDKQFDLVPTMQAMLRYYRALAKQGGIDIATERKLSLQADLLQMEKDEASGALLRASEVELAWADVLLTLRHRILHNQKLNEDLKRELLAELKGDMQALNDSDAWHEKIKATAAHQEANPPNARSVRSEEGDLTRDAGKPGKG